MNHDVRFLSHSSSILFLICVAVVAWMASQDAKVDLKPLIVAVIPIYYLSETINLFFVLFLCVFNKLIIFSAS
jgi:hypothetical protein